MDILSRRNFIKLTAVGVASASLGGGLCACSSSGSDSAVGGSLTGSAELNQVIVAMTTGSEPSAGFDPLVAWGCGEHVHEPLIQSTLITTDVNLEFQNDLATWYECSEDSMTWTFTIRDDAYFTDGHLLVASDVAFTINQIIASGASECDLSMVDNAYATDDTTVVIAMTKPFNMLLYTLAVVGIVPEHAYGEKYGSSPVGSGRYQLVQWDKGQQVILEANPNYYGEAPTIERLVVLFMEESASLAAAQSGQVDVAYTSSTFASSDVSGYDLFSCATVDSRGVSLPSVAPGGTKSDEKGDYDTGNQVTCDKAIRQAINYGVNRDRLIEGVLDGHGQAAYSVGDGMPWSSSDMQCETDTALAHEILEEGGWFAAADGIREKDGVRAAFDLYYASSDSVRQAIATDFSNQMRELGIEVTVTGASWDDIYPHQYSSPVVWGWGTNSPIETYNLNYSQGMGNYACYESATSDAYMDAALAQSNIEDSYELWQKAQWDGSEGFAPQGEASWVWLANVDHLYFAAQGLSVANQKPHPHGLGWSLVNNVDAWSWS